MENELTPQSHLAYPLTRSITDSEQDPQASLMDENGEVKKPEDQSAESEKREPITVTPEVQARARRAWEEENRKKEAQGIKITDEQREIQRQMTERGMGPQVAGGDKRFEKFDPEKYKNSRLYKLAKELKEDRNVTQEKLNEIIRQSNELVILNGVSDDESAQFIKDINAIITDPNQANSQTGERLKVEILPPTADDLKKYSEFNADLFAGTPLAEIAARIKRLPTGGVDDSLEKISAEYRSIRDSLSPELKTQYDEEIMRVQGLSNPEKVISLSEKYQDNPQLLAIVKEVEGLKALGRFNNQAQARIGQNLQQMLGRGEISIEDAKEFLADIDKLTAGDSADRREPVRRNNIMSIQDVAKIIINDEGEDRWGNADGTPSDAIYPLLEKVGDKVHINKANFIQWARERTMYHHTNNPRDLQLAITQLVGIDNDFGSTISIFSMDKNRNKYFKDEASGRIMDDLADQLKTEVWLFGSMRKYDLMYKEYMGQDTKLPEFLASVHNLEELTSSDSMERIMTLSEKFRGDQEEGQHQEKDMKVGDAARKSYEIYYYMSDIEKLKEILGPDSIFFKKQGLINVFKIIDRIAHTDEIEEKDMKQIETLFNADGSLKEAEFINFINPFNDQNKPDRNIAIARELVRQAVAEKYGLEYGLEKKVKEERGPTGKYRAPERAFLRINTEYAETWAWILSRFTGAAARNDTNSIGFDAFTKTMQFMKYRIRQSQASRAGQFGNEYNLGVFKTLTLDFFNGVWVQKTFDESGRTTPFELMMELDKKDRELEQLKKSGENDARVKEIEAEKWKLAKQFRFDQSTQKGYATNHLGRAFEIFHNMLGNEELRLDQIVKYEQFGTYAGRYVIDRTKFEEALKEKFVKPVRYAFSTYPMIDFGKETRELVKAGSAKEKPVYRTTTVAQSIFGPIVTEEIKRDIVAIKKRIINAKIAKNKKEGKPKDDGLNDREKEILKKRRFKESEKDELWKEMLNGPSADLRPILWKRAVMARIAKDLLSHRQRSQNNKYEYFHHEQIELFLHALESIPSIDVLEADDGSDLAFSYGEKFLNEDDMHWIRQQSQTTEGKLFTKDVLPNIAGGFAKGIGEGFLDIFKGAFK